MSEQLGGVMRGCLTIGIDNIRETSEVETKRLHFVWGVKMHFGCFKRESNDLICLS